MKVLLDEQGYIQSYAVIGDLVDGIDLPDPEDALHFEENFNAYRQRVPLLGWWCAGYPGHHTEPC